MTRAGKDEGAFLGWLASFRTGQVDDLIEAAAACPIPAEAHWYWWKDIPPRLNFEIAAQAQVIRVGMSDMIIANWDEDT